MIAQTKTGIFDSRGREISENDNVHYHFSHKVCGKGVVKNISGKWYVMKDNSNLTELTENVGRYFTITK